MANFFTQNDTWESDYFQADDLEDAQRSVPNAVPTPFEIGRFRQSLIVNENIQILFYPPDGFLYRLERRPVLHDRVEYEQTKVTRLVKVAESTY